MNTTMLKAKDVLTLLGHFAVELICGREKWDLPKAFAAGPKGRDCYWPKEVIQAVIENEATQPQ
jgi:hypothetical protein